MDRYMRDAIWDALDRRWVYYHGSARPAAGHSPVVDPRRGSAPLFASRNIDGTALLRGPFRQMVERLDDELGAKSPDERAWYALGVTSGLNSFSWPQFSTDGVRGLAKRLDTSWVDSDRVTALSRGSSKFDFQVAIAKLAAMLAAARGVGGEQLRVCVYISPVTRVPGAPVVERVGAAALADAGWSFEEELDRAGAITMRRLLLACYPPVPPAEESMKRIDDALGEIAKL